MRTFIICTVLLLIPPRLTPFSGATVNYLNEERVSIHFNEKVLKKALYELVEHPEIAYAQAILESGWFTSDIFKENNNLFGMKHPQVRETLSKGVNRGHAVYDTWLDSVKDYALWQKYYQSHGYCIQDYDVYLRKFNSHHSYIHKVKSLINK